MPIRWEQILAGTAAGAVATVPMTALMVAWHRRLPPMQRDPLPPAKIAHRAAQSVAADSVIDMDHEMALAIAAHFGYGTAMGTVFGAFPQAKTAIGAGVAGAAFGVGVWAGSYMAWLPVTGLHRSALSEPDDRNALMIAAHIVWGGALGVLTHAIRQRLPSRHPDPRNHAAGIEPAAEEAGQSRVAV